MTISEFILNTSLDSVPERVVLHTKRAVIDLIGVMLAGTLTKAGKIITDFTCELSPNSEDASIYGMKRKTSLVGATLANAIIVDSLDASDGYRAIKGHPGAFVIPAALVIAENKKLDGKKFLEGLITGYEIGIRAGIATHQTYHTYHASGSWGGIGTAAICAKLLNFNPDQINNALGIAEYYGALAPMMRCIDSPAMVKDAIGWGAMVGISSALLAQKGFTGIPSLLLQPQFSNLQQSLGKDYQILNLYFKPYPTCRWGHPAIDGVLKILSEHPAINEDNIGSIVVKTFEEATRIKHQEPKTTEEAQYSLPYPVAAAIIYGEAGPKQILEESLADPKVLAMARKVKFVYSLDIQKEFPEKTLAEVEMVMKNGEIYKSGIISAKGDLDNLMSDREIEEKFRRLTEGILDKNQKEEVITFVNTLEKQESLDELFDIIR